MSKHKQRSAEAPASDDTAQEPRPPRSPPGEGGGSGDSGPVAPGPWHEWMPSSEAPVLVRWQSIGEKFHVLLLLQVVTGSAVADDAAQLHSQQQEPPPPAVPVWTWQTIVETTLHDRNKYVPFSMRTEMGPGDILSGRFEFRRLFGSVQLWILGLRYPGGSVDKHWLQ